MIEEIEFTDEESAKVVELLDYIYTFARLHGNVKTMDMLNDMINELK